MRARLGVQPFALMSLWPDNQAHGFNGTIGADLPFKSRYMGTVSYIMMRQNEAFLPFTNHTGTIAFLIILATTPASSGASGLEPERRDQHAPDQQRGNDADHARAEIEAELSLLRLSPTTRPSCFSMTGSLTDVKLRGTLHATYAPVHSLSVSYIKQNGGAELVWSPNSRMESRRRLRLRAIQLDSRGRQRHQREFRQGVRRLEAVVWLTGARELESFRPPIRQLRLPWLRRQLPMVGSEVCINPVSCNVQYNDCLSAVLSRQPSATDRQVPGRHRRATRSDGNADLRLSGRQLLDQRDRGRPEPLSVGQERGRGRLCHRSRDQHPVRLHERVLSAEPEVYNAKRPPRR